VNDFRPAARLARREVARRPGRTLLVSLLVAAPVAAMLVGAVFVRTEHVSPLEYWHSTYGQADVVVQTQNGAASRPNAAIRALLSGHAVKTEHDLSTQVLRTVDGHVGQTTLAIVQLRDPLTRGTFVVKHGRFPSAANEVFLTRALARDLGVRVGQELRLAAPVQDTFRVSGVGEAASQFGESEIVLPPNSTWQPALPDATVSWLVDPPASVSVGSLQQLSGALEQSTTTPFGLQISPRLVPQDGAAIVADADNKVRWSWLLGAVALTVTGIVIAAAFAVGARRQLVTMGLLGANGGSPRFLYLVLLLQGTWTGVIGAVLGVGLGAGVLTVLRPHVADLVGHVTGAYVFRGTDLFPIVALGVVAASIAAAVPARIATRIPVLSALAGRRPLGRVPVWLPLAGAGTVLVGLAMFGQAVDNSKGAQIKSNSVWLSAILGLVLTLLGGCAIAPAFVSALESVAARCVGAARVATRSLARQRTRAAAVVSAVAATAALAIGGSAVVLGQHAAHVHKASSTAPNEVAVSGPTLRDGSSPPSGALVTAVARVLPSTERIPVRVVVNRLTWSVHSVKPADDFEWGPYAGAGVGAVIGPITIADPSSVSLYRLSDGERRALARDGWLMFGGSNGQIDFTLGTQGPDSATITMGRAVAEVHALMLSWLDHDTGAGLIVTPAKAAQLHLQSEIDSIVLRTPRALTAAQRVAIEGLPGSTLFVAMYTPPAPVSPFLGDWALAGFALALVLFVVAVNLALSAAEGRDERDVLAIVGATPRTMSRTSGYKAVILTFMGAVLAIPIGYLPVAIYVHAMPRAIPGAMPLEFPWRVVTLLLLAVPVVSGLVVSAGSAVATRLRPVRISTMAFD
jgi:putative ABC transport system permease protein